MSQHLHSTYRLDCYRCELGLDEADVVVIKTDTLEELLRLRASERPATKRAFVKRTEMDD